MNFDSPLPWIIVGLMGFLVIAAGAQLYMKEMIQTPEVVVASVLGGLALFFSACYLKSRT